MRSITTILNVASVTCYATVALCDVTAGRWILYCATLQGNWRSIFYLDPSPESCFRCGIKHLARPLRDIATSSLFYCCTYLYKTDWIRRCKIKILGTV